MSSSSSSDLMAVEEAKFIGSVMAKTVAYYQNRLGETSCARPNLKKSSLRRNYEAEHDCLIEDYFVDDVVYAIKFRRRFRMRKELMLRIGDLEGRFPYFQWKMDAMQRYLRKPTINDIHQFYMVHEGEHGFPGMLAGANNDINVLDQSPVFNDIYLGKSHDVPFQANMVVYKRGYYLTDGIYPPLSVFVKLFTCPNDPKRKKFKEAQESARKDVERAFGVLKRRWQVLTVGARSYEVKRLQHVMYACVILHNMILEDEGRAICRYNENEVLPNVEGVAVDEDSDMLVESEDSDDESDVVESNADDQGYDEDDDFE
ncbi:uncharacterized protein LOC128132813 [Lactuca sativa]|uniref:uncharacterized protein LOC128132813 n=1 Tax=Lactuca sativa TaxID=4236 RepID=UPI0022AF1D2C|nr:uncharacterized protein LOC128132813 [Lactuca sativa]